MGHEYADGGGDKGIFVNCIKSKRILILSGFTVALVITVIALATALGVANKKLSEKAATVSSSPTTSASLIPSLSSTITVKQMIAHLQALQNISSTTGGNRFTGSNGFNKTVSYIVDYLRTKTNLEVHTLEYFSVPNYQLDGEPTLIIDFNGTRDNYTYATDFTDMQYASRAYGNLSQPVSVIPEFGCFPVDWERANPKIQNRTTVALVKRGQCTSVEKSRLAAKYDVGGLLVYNDGASWDRNDPLNFRVGFYTSFPALFLSFDIGNRIKQIIDFNGTVEVTMKVTVEDLDDFNVSNVCADTRSGNISKTIVVGSHTDSVKESSGINDNGSGTAANLVLATNVDSLLNTPSYPKYPNRIRFCWWGAEEVGLRGSIHHIKQAVNNTKPGENLRDYLVNLNLDMLASPNFNFGIFSGSSIDNSTDEKAINGSILLTNLFIKYFNDNKLPWSPIAFDGRSDYGPFLAAGKACAGLTTGGDAIKTQDERDRYAAQLPQGENAGIVNAMLDPCYHNKCDTIENINWYAYEVMVKAAAFVLENIGQRSDLDTWLYSSLVQSGRSEDMLKYEIIENTVLSQYYRKTDL